MNRSDIPHPETSANQRLSSGSGSPSKANHILDAKLTPPSQDNPTTVLVVDDSQINIDLVQNHLKRMNLTSTSARSGSEAIELVRKIQPSLILLDVMMPGMSGLEVCRILKGDPATSTIPIIFLSARKQTDHKVQGMAIGAVDYITKPFDPSELEIRIRSALRTKSLQDTLSAQAYTDALTGLYNWRYFHEILSREVERARLGTDPLSIILVDVDMFKVVNDCYGHQMGDKVLCYLADTISQTTKPTDYIARYGGDEMAIVLPLTTLNDAKNLAQRLCQRLSQNSFGDRGFTLEIACSFGVATLGPGDKASAEALVRMADEALYTAKRQGRNQVCVWSGAQKEQLSASNSKVFEQLHQMRTHVASINAQSRKQAMESMWTLVKALEARDPYSAHHSENVMQYAIAIAREMGLATPFVQHIHNAAILHDIGKIGVPDRVLKKIGKLSNSEWKLMKQHPLMSAEILGQLTVLKREVLSVKHHHEHFDGSGYPDGLAGKQIPIGARILTVADSFDAITSSRIYRPAKNGQAAIAEIARCSSSQFDPEVAQAFLRIAQEHEDTWPIQRHGREISICEDLATNSQPDQSCGSAENQLPPDRWTPTQLKIEEALADLAESLDKLSSSRSGQNLDSLEIVLAQFQTQAEDLSALAKEL